MASPRQPAAFRHARCRTHYGFAGQTILSETSGGAPCGATTITGGDGSRQPSDNELAAARYQGGENARIPAKLHG